MHYSTIIVQVYCYGKMSRNTVFGFVNKLDVHLMNAERVVLIELQAHIVRSLGLTDKVSENLGNKLTDYLSVSRRYTVEAAALRNVQDLIVY
jgi:uncharacterized tellurite resistance protein B-like protein